MIYFVFHVFGGARGAISFAKLTKEIASLDKELKELREQNAALDNKIRMIRSDNIDLDLLEEQAHSVIGFANEKDIIVLLPN